ncbi:TetR/AcrR family transcriptional regulator [Winogradskyella maritima]|uniref:TetR/AcrR family transcriptional regulator n=1 Tax=Winogradskyella maritima TaxID=1517766 RepID=A0ABV8AM59_9FLAO|nr:TetR/AcrR family transcriptional regulator [Winogradskyella maritima]
MKTKARKKEILSVAAILFKQKGYSAVTMRDLASELGIKAASLYNHISSKQDILEAIIIEIAEDFTSGMKAIMTSEGSTIERLKRVIQLHIKIATENANGLAALNTDWMHLENRLDYYLKLRQEYEANFKSILEKGMENGELKHINPDTVVFSMLSTLRSLYLWIPKKSDLKLDTFSEELQTLLLKGLAS